LTGRNNKNLVTQTRRRGSCSPDTCPCRRPGGSDG
jgi:hypothetical protein